MSQLATSSPAAGRRVGVAAAGAQLALALSWTVYVVFLPGLAAQAGLSPQAVLWLLVLDQAVFVLADYACGVASDRVLAQHRRVAPWLAGATGLSAAAFLAVPWLAPQGSPALFLAVTLVWTASSSALRAPALNLIGRHAVKPAQPGLVALAMLGLGLAAAVAPWLALQLKGSDPRLPFVVASAGVVLAALALAWAEQQAPPRAAAAGTAAPPQAAAVRGPLLLAAALMAALALQMHTNLNAAVQFGRFVPAGALPYWLPVFWAAFNLGLWPAMKLAPRCGALRLVALAALLAAAAAGLAWLAPTLWVLAAAQALAGAAWAAMLAGGFAAALALGHVGREGRFSGAVSSSLAAAAMLRLMLVASGAAAALRAAGSPLLEAAPVALWGGAALLLALALGPRRRAR